MRKVLPVATVVLIVATCTISFSQSASQPPTSPTIPALPDVKPELLRLVIDDQWDRGNDMFSGRQVKSPDSLDWNAIGKRDQEREAAVRALLASGKIESGREFHFAALIFQHSSTDAGIALAQVLAMTAVIKGDGSAKWLAAAAVDRFLQRQKQPQLFGTQFMQENGRWTMAPDDRAVLSDSVRALWCVVPKTSQDDALKAMQEGNSVGANTSISDCK